MDAIILAGGRGNRLKPYTNHYPKALAPVGGQPVLGIILRQLQATGVRNITVAVNYMGDLIKSTFGDGKQYGLHIRYSEEAYPLGTVGPVKLVRDLPENFIVMNCDVLANINFRHLYDLHLISGNLLTVTLYEKDVQLEFGVLKVDDKRHEVIEFIEKPFYKFNINVGIYVFNREILAHIPEGEAYGMDDLIVSLIKLKYKVRAYIHKGDWLDIGRPDDLREAAQMLKRLDL